MPKYEALAHVIWELPFPLRLPAQAFVIWEPDEGVALFDPRPGVGELCWKRQSELLPLSEVFKDSGPANDCYPTHDYLIASKLRSGKEVKTAMLTRGPTGGFVEPRPYAVANLFLCLRHKADYSAKRVLERAGLALNNVLDLYRFVTMDPLVRSVRADLDCYYTMVSVGELPASTGDIEASAALSLVGKVSFGSVIGVNRAHHVV